jgi:hypothetical protein
MKTLLCIILFSVVFLSGCTRVLIREPFGQALKEDDLGSVPAVYVDGSGNQFRLQKAESPDEFQVVDLSEYSNSYNKVRFTIIDPEADAPVFLGWFWDPKHEAWAIVRMLGNLDGGVCLMAPDMESLNQEYSNEESIRIEKLKGKKYDTAYLIEGEIPLDYWTKNSSWDLEGVRCFFDLSEFNPDQSSPPEQKPDS